MNQLNLFAGTPFPFDRSTPPKSWDKARSDPDFSNLLKEKPVWNMKGLTFTEWEMRLSLFLASCEIPRDKKVLFLDQVHTFLGETRVYVIGLLNLAVRDNGKVAQKVLDHIDQLKLRPACLEVIEEKEQIPVRRTRQFTHEMDLLSEIFSGHVVH